jgi:hypothetical protein
MSSPFANVVSSRTISHDYIHLVLHALLADELQSPIPVVVVKRAETFVARFDVPPSRPVERHPHVVLRAYPSRAISLKNA